MSLQRALDETRTGDIWLFRGTSGPDRAIQSMTNSPVNHVGMTIAIEDLPPLIWHAELGDKLTDMWTGGNHRGVQLHDARQAVERWMYNYHQRCWLRQLTPYANREQEDRALKVVARMDGTPFPSTARLTGRWFRGRVAVADYHARNPVRAQQGSRSHPAQESGEAPSRPGDGVLRRDRRHHLRGDGSAHHREALQLVRRRIVLERRLAAPGSGLPARRRNRRPAIDTQSTLISASFDQPVASMVWLITFGVCASACGRSRCAALK